MGTATHLDELSTGERWLRHAKVAGLTARRLARWALDDSGQPQWGPETDFPELLGEHRVVMRRPDDDADERLEAGKLRNLAIAAPRFDGRVMCPGEPLSFWRTLGRVTASRGYKYGLELRGGCLVPSVGGGICLLSNALFEMTVRHGWQVIERHGHTLEAIPPRPGELWGVDATVFWPYVDVIVSPPEDAGPVRLGVALEGDELVLRLRGQAPATQRFELSLVDEQVLETDLGRFREGRVVRRAFDAASGDAVGAPETVAVNRRRVLSQLERRANCLTCGKEATCDARPALKRGRFAVLP